MNRSVSICTQNPQTYLILSHILSVAGYSPNLMDMAASLDSAREALPFAILFDTTEDIEPILELCASFKHDTKTKNIVLIALLPPSNTRNFLRFLQIGIDECITHPFVPERILAFLHDRQSVITSHTSQTRVRRSGTLIENLEILPEKRVLRHGEAEIQLTPTEFRILEGLIDAPGHVLNREQIIKVGWPSNHYVQTRTVDVHVGKLRRQLLNLTGKNLIRTVRSAGYALEVLK